MRKITALFVFLILALVLSANPTNAQTTKGKGKKSATLDDVVQALVNLQGVVEKGQKENKLQNDILGKGLTDVKTELKATNGRLDTVVADVATIKSDVAVIKTDVSAIKADVTIIKVDVAGLKTDVAAVKISMEEMRKELEKAKTNNQVVTINVQPSPTVVPQVVYRDRPVYYYYPPARRYYSYYDGYWYGYGY